MGQLTQHATCEEACREQRPAMPVIKAKLGAFATFDD